ncbi:MAG: ABC transporter permease [Alphaproteobacteria bacterium]|nr:MAG: ABC transporter permease [Alphaproteobacteria bacterium]
MNTSRIFWQLLKTDLIFFKRRFIEAFINLAIWVVCTIFVNVYVLQKLGLQQGYGQLMVAGIMVSAAWFEMLPHMINAVSDFFGDRHIDYHLTLPMSNYLIFIKSVCAYIIDVFVFTIIGLIFAAVLMSDQVHLSQISPLHMSIAIILTSVFFGSFILFLTSICKNPGYIGTVISRIIFPLWFLGGFAFPWETLYEIAPTISYIALINPYTYMTEMLRVATIGQQGFLPFWPSALALITLTVITGYMGIQRLKYKLDFI